MGIRIITDSTSDLSLEQARQAGIEMVPLKVSFGSEEYIDKFTITNEEFYEKLKASDVLPTTTLVSPQQFLEVFNRYPDDDLVGIFISNKLSGTYQSAVMAKEESGRENIYLLDSGTASCGLALLLEQAVRLKDDGLTAAEIAERIGALAPRVEIYAIFNTLKYLVKGGRLSGAQGLLGSMLGIKPVLSVRHGALSTLGKERGMKKASDFVLERLRSLPDFDGGMPVAFAHSDNATDLDYLRQHFPEGTVYGMGSVVGTHAGPGAVMIAFFHQ